MTHRDEAHALSRRAAAGDLKAAKELVRLLERREFERRARAGDMEALAEWAATAISVGNAKEVSDVDRLASDLVGWPPRSVPEPVRHVRRIAAEFRLGLPPGSLEEPKDANRGCAQVDETWNGGTQASCRFCGWSGPVRHETVATSYREAASHRCPSRGSKDPLADGVYHSCGRVQRRRELASRKIAYGLWEIRCSACGNVWDYQNG